MWPISTCGRYRLCLWPIWSSVWPISLWPIWFVADIDVIRGSPRHMWLGHHFQDQKSKDKLVVDVLNSQHAGTGVTCRRIKTKILLCRNSTATWRINMNIVSTSRGRRHIVAASPLQLVHFSRICPSVNFQHRKRNCQRRDSLIRVTVSRVANWLPRS